MVYQVSYDLKSPSSEYATLYDKIKSLGDYLPILQSTWLICSPLSPEQMTDQLSPIIKNGDRFFISEIQLGKYNGWHSRATWDWLRSHLIPS